VPAPVKRTWGRAKAKQAAEKRAAAETAEGDEGAAVDGDGSISGSTMSLPPPELGSTAALVEMTRSNEQF
jgi:hypothetical protein